MADRDVFYTRRSMGEMVDRLDPKRLTTPQPAYIFPAGKIKVEPPDQPGKKYHWAKELPDV